jgi:hypothetical protein
MTDASRPFLWPKKAEEWAHLPIPLGINWLKRISRSYAAQLCGEGRTVIFEEVMKTTELDSYLLVGACAPRVQDKHFVPVDIRGTDNKVDCGSFAERC